MDYPFRNMEDFVAGSGLNCAFQEVSVGKNFSMWPTDCFCDILVTVAAFCHCPKSLPKAKVKRFRLIALTKEVSKQPGIYSVVWFLKFTLTKKSALMKRSKLRQKNKQNVWLKY